MASVLDEVLAYLIAQGLGTSKVTTGSYLMVKNKMPPRPDEVGCVYETGGNPSELKFGSATILHELPVIQVVFRGGSEDYDSPREKSKTAFEKMVAIGTQTAMSGSIIYLLVQPVQSPFPLDKDEKLRYRIACNFSIRKEPS